MYTGEGMTRGKIRRTGKVYWMDDTISIPNINLVESSRLLLRT